MNRLKRRQLGILIVLSLMLFTIFTPPNVLAETNTSTLLAADSGKAVSRFAGIDQYETSAKIAEAGWKEASDAVVLAAGTQPNLIDAMSAGPLASVLNAPIVLTDTGNELNSFAKAEIARLKPQKAYITSGQAVIKPAVLEELRSMGVTPVELGGYDQYETAVNIAKEMQSLGDRFTKLAVVAGWVSPADALSIGSIAASEQMPVLATTKDELPAKVKDYVDSLSGSITDSYVIGGTAVVSDEIKNSLPGNQQRYYGNTKYETNLDVLKKCADNLNYKAVYVANGETLVDALAGVPLAAQDAAPIILTNQSMDPDLLNYAKTNLSPVVIALGGEAVVNQETLDQLSNYDVEPGNDKTMGSDNPNLPEKLQKTLLLSGDNVTLQNASEDFSIYINGNNDILKNVNIKGTLFIDPGVNGKVSLDNVTAAQTVVLSGTEEGLQLKDIKVDDLRIFSFAKIIIAPTGNSMISNTTVSTDATIDATQGTWGSVRLARTISPESVVELKGTFNHDVFVSSPGILKADQNATVNKVIVMPQESGLVTLDGPFKVVQIEQQAQVSLAATAKVDNLVTHAQTSLNVEKGATVAHLYNGDFSTLSGDGAQDLPAADLNDPYSIINNEGYKTKNPALKITAPQDGAVLDFDGEVTVTWAAVSGATGYAVEVHDLDNPWPYLADWVTNIPAGTQSFTLPKYRITTTGHHYVIIVHYEMPIDPDVGSAGLGSMPPIQVQIGKSPNISPLVITSPGSNATFSFGTQIPLQWDVPPDASKLNAEVLIQGNVITEFPIQNGQDISQHLYQGKNHVTVSLKSDNVVVYQGSLDITMIPSSPMSDTPDILTPSTGSTIDPNHPLTVTWKPVAGATDYSISVYREDGAISSGVGFFHAGTLTSFQLYPLSDGVYHMFVRAEVDNLLRDGDLITVNAPKADPSIVSPPPLNIVPLQIVSPTNNITVSGNEPVILKWNVPKFAAFLNADVKITNSLGYTSGYYNGENINRPIQKDMNSLSPGLNHVTVTLSEPGDITEYQGSVDIIYNP
ncbi:cell wall-binding protein [Desulfosporosinus orientis DSM 765]|uniref:Cell wall-binding protein n=1 Tax=Desulfosporosinus orientis (strain ATCC 19365 / DSM 765 / NCIMB 8382 / VKM B-1628 / Singapore I) TaxID=768706 RepID=G7WJ14_DESOD|nr:cell wall-binding repeat-containing protein [Desulfosporosinus orientis]AET69739.1 cell wall-binding protein [Desulfosporosinus orientis DSM 765]